MVKRGLRRKGSKLKPCYLKDIVDQIIKTAKDGGFDLVVAGARGLSRVKGLLMGSVSNGVTRNALCSVLVAR